MSPKGTRYLDDGVMTQCCIEVIACDFSRAKLVRMSRQRPRSFPSWVAMEVLEMAELAPGQAYLDVLMFAKVTPLLGY